MNGFAQAVEKSKIAYKNAGAFFYGAFFSSIAVGKFSSTSRKRTPLGKTGVFKF